MPGDHITLIDAYIIALKQEYDPTGYGTLLVVLVLTMLAVTQVREVA